MLLAALPGRGLCQKSKACKCGNKSKEGITVALIMNAVGEKEKQPLFVNRRSPDVFAL